MADEDRRKAEEDLRKELCAKEGLLEKELCGNPWSNENCAGLSEAVKKTKFKDRLDLVKPYRGRRCHACFRRADRQRKMGVRTVLYFLQLHVCIVCIDVANVAK